MKSMKNTPGYGKDMPPTLQQVRIYFSQKKRPEGDANDFFYHYKCLKWNAKRGDPL